jgi:hypothetical protein
MPSLWVTHSNCLQLNKPEFNFLIILNSSSGDSQQLGRNDSERRDDNQGRNHNERQNDNLDRDTDKRQHIAQTTLETLDEGEYFPPGQDGPYDLSAKIQWTEENTRYYGPGAGTGEEISKSGFINDDDNANSKLKIKLEFKPLFRPEKGPLLSVLRILQFASESTLLSSAHVKFT